MKRPCILLLTACLLGELVGYYLSISQPGPTLLAVPATVFVTVKVLKKIQIKKSYVAVFFFVLTVFICRVKYEIRHMNCFIKENTEKIVESGEFCGKVTDMSFKGENVIFKSSGLLIYLKKELYRGDVRLGNTLHFSGKISQLKRAANPGEFDFFSYYRSKRIYFRMNAGEYDITDSRFNRGAQLIFGLRECLGNSIDDIFAGKEAGVIKAMLLGDRGELDRDMYKLYQENGIAHLLAISGLHVSLLGMGFYKLLRKRCHLSFTLSALLSGSILLFYGALVGEGVSVVRASSMLIIYFIAEICGRSYCIISALCVSAVTICFLSPFELFGAGFQLSFAAVFGIGGPISFVLKTFKVKDNTLKNKCLKLISRKKIFEAAVLSIGVQVITLPFILYYFYTLPLYAFALNIAVIPMMSLVLYSALAALGLHFFSTILSGYVGTIACQVLRLYELLCHLVSSLPAGSIVFGRPSVCKIIVYYLVVFIIIFAAARYRRRLLLIFTLPAVLILFPFFRAQKLVFLDVGQGDGIYMHIDNMDILIDGGSSSNKSLGEYTMKPFLLYEGADDIEMAFVTHSDIDHISGILYLLENGTDIEKLFLPYQATWDASYNEIKEKAQKAGSEIRYLSMGDRFDTEDLKIECLWPDRTPKEDVNEESLVLLVHASGRRFLFTGDIGNVSERSILEKYNIGRVDILKVAHHGSDNSSLEAFIENTMPEYAVISCGENNRYGHPGKKTIATLKKYGCKILETTKMGAIEVGLE